VRPWWQDVLIQAAGIALGAGVLAAIAAASGLLHTTSLARIASWVGIGALFITLAVTYAGILYFGPRAEMRAEEERGRRRVGGPGRTE
jgi:hypothetical protein